MPAATAPAVRKPSFAGVGPSLDRIATTGKKLPPRIILYAPPKWGKTSFGAMSTKPIFLMTRGEDGLQTLIDSKQLDDTPHFQDQATTWNELLLAIDSLVVHDHDYKTFVLDTLDGGQRLAFEAVCQDKFKGDWADFDSWARGPKASIAHFIELTKRLDRLRAAKGMAIVLLCHVSVEKFTNPEGPDYDRYQPNIDRKYVWPELKGWADMILFGNFETHVSKDNPKDRKGKADGGQTRMLYTEHTAAFDAGNRHGLPAEIELGATPQEAWQNFQSALKGAK